MTRLALAFKRGEEWRIRQGHPWAFSNELDLRPEHRAVPPGTVVSIASSNGAPLGVFFFNPHSLIAARRLDADPVAAIDPAWLAARLQVAASLRASFFDRPFYRLCHGEADFMPGLIVDRYDDVLVVQQNSAGMELLTEALVKALTPFSPRAIVLRNDSHARAGEGLAAATGIAQGALPDQVVVEEGGVSFPVDVMAGQKTGWFFDQRANRDAVAPLAAGARVLDCFCHTGAFGLRAARAGAAHVTLVDRSELALDLATRTAAANGLGDKITTRREEAFAFLEAAAAAGQRYELVIADPPAFAKVRRDQGAALKGYAKLARQAAAVVAPGGLLFLASCSHHVDEAAFLGAVREGLSRAGRQARILRSGGAGTDHPVHPHLPESAYLKSLLLALD